MIVICDHGYGSILRRKYINIGTYLYINPEKGVDISGAVYKLVGIEDGAEMIVEGGQPVLNVVQEVKPIEQ